MKTLFYFRAEPIYGTLFVNEAGERVRYIHENDAEVSQEYWSFVAEYFGGRLVGIVVADPEEPESEHDIDGFVELNKQQILAAIERQAARP